MAKGSSMSDKQTMVTAETALPGRATPMTVEETHFVNQSSLNAKPSSSFGKNFYQRIIILSKKK